MSKFYTYAAQYGNNILFRGYEDGRQIIEKIPFQPTLFVEANGKQKVNKGGWKSLYDGKSLEPIKFDSIKDAKNYLEQYKDIEGFPVHGFQKFQYQFIYENYGGDISYNIDDINMLVFDIEVITADGSFPDIERASAPVVLISFYSTRDKKTIVYGTKEYKKTKDDTFEYHIFNDEKQMLLAFVNYINRTKPDVWTGWNIDYFDIPYLITRIINVLDESYAKMLSPFNMIRDKLLISNGKEVNTYEVMGLVSLDYLELYKKFGTYSAKESYALGFIANEEIGATKVEMPGESFHDNYENYFQTFVQYSAVDTDLIQKLNDKLKLIELAFAMAFMYHCNLSDIYRTVVPWEVFIYNYLSDNKIAVPPRKNGAKGAVEGAWVKAGAPDMYGWVMSFDFASLYPSVIRQWNISPETFVAPITDVGVADFLAMNERASACIDGAREMNCTIAANGSMYKKDARGFLPELMRYCMEGRKIAKKEMLKLEAEYQQTGDKSLLPRIAALNNKQMALKIAANSAYGAIGNEGFHYYDYRMAEAITLTGQLSDIHLANAMSAKINSVLKTDGIDYIIYGDTDSIYLNCQKLVDKFCAGRDVDFIVNFLDRFGEQVCQPVINKSVQDIFDQMNAYDLLMASKREAIASRMLFRMKKNYAMLVHNSEGVVYNPPKVKVMGIEIVRSSTPKWCRSHLKECLQIIFTGSESDLRKKYAESREEFMKLSPEDIAFPRGISDIDKWMVGDGGYKKGCPIHVRASILYNYHTKGLGKYARLVNGDKIRFVYLKTPNVIHENVIGFPSTGKLPAELGLHPYVDYEFQFEKVFKSPLESLTAIAKWNLEEVATLEDFFV